MVHRLVQGFLRGGVTRQFAVLSLAVIALISVALYLVLSFYLEKGLLESEWTVTADYVRTEALYHLSREDLEAPWSPRAAARFRDFYAQTVTMPEIVRLKIYDANATVVWSDEPRLLRTRFPENVHLKTALAGRTVVNLETGHDKPEHVYERGRFGRLVEVYVPLVFPGSDQVVGVIETYKSPTRVFNNIRQAQLVVLVTAAGGGAFLYVALYGIVHRAAARIREQHETLAQRSRDLARTNRALEQRGRELVAANEELRAVQVQLVETERMAAIGEVVTAVAHGIRNPLANIRAAAEVAHLTGGTPAAAGPPRSALQRIVGEVDRLERQLRDLLHFVRPGARGEHLVDLNAVVGESLRSLAGRLEQAGLAVTTCLAPALPSVRGDAVLLEQVVLGLLSNAVEASPGGAGSIGVRTWAEPSDEAGPRVAVEVRDEGVGIPPEAMEKIFVAFYTTKAQGTGLGLAIARKFTEAYGGRISVESRPGKGTTFRLTFPASAVGEGAAR